MESWESMAGAGREGPVSRFKRPEESREESPTVLLCYCGVGRGSYYYPLLYKMSPTALLLLATSLRFFVGTFAHTKTLR